MKWIELWAMMEVIGGFIAIALVIIYIIYMVIEKLKTKRRMKKNGKRR